MLQARWLSDSMTAGLCIVSGPVHHLDGYLGGVHTLGTYRVVCFLVLFELTSECHASIESALVKRGCSTQAGGMLLLAHLSLALGKGPACSYWMQTWALHETFCALFDAWHAGVQMWCSTEETHHC
jgi:hypothetical protein